MKSVADTMSLQTINEGSISFSKRDKRKRLPADYCPGKFSVLCGRGKSCTNSTGNLHLKTLVQNSLEGYSKAKNKVEKSVIVSKIISTIKQKAPEGAFVKEEDGEWWTVSECFAREKIGCMFRDYLHTQYRSSTKSKNARKKQVKKPSALDVSDHTTSSSTTASGYHSQLAEDIFGPHEGEDEAFPAPVQACNTPSAPIPSFIMGNMGCGSTMGNMGCNTNFQLTNTSPRHLRPDVLLQRMPLSSGMPMNNKRNGMRNAVNALEEAYALVDDDHFACSMLPNTMPNTAAYPSYSVSNDQCIPPAAFDCFQSP